MLTQLVIFMKYLKYETYYSIPFNVYYQLNRIIQWKIEFFVNL